MPMHERRRTAVSVSASQAPGPPLQSASRRPVVGVPVLRALHLPKRACCTVYCHISWVPFLLRTCRPYSTLLPALLGMSSIVVDRWRGTLPRHLFPSRTTFIYLVSCPTRKSARLDIHSTPSLDRDFRMLIYPFQPYPVGIRGEARPPWRRLARVFPFLQRLVLAGRSHIISA